MFEKHLVTNSYFAVTKLETQANGRRRSPTKPSPLEVLGSVTAKNVHASTYHTARNEPIRASFGCRPANEEAQSITCPNNAVCAESMSMTFHLLDVPAQIPVLSQVMFAPHHPLDHLRRPQWLFYCVLCGKGYARAFLAVYIHIHVDSFVNRHILWNQEWPALLFTNSSRLGHASRRTRVEFMETYPAILARSQIATISRQSRTHSRTASLRVPSIFEIIQLSRNLQICLHVQSYLRQGT